MCTALIVIKGSVIIFDKIEVMTRRDRSPGATKCAGYRLFGAGHQGGQLRHVFSVFKLQHGNSTEN